MVLALRHLPHTAMIDVEITARRAGCFYRYFPAARSTIAYT